MSRRYFILFLLLVLAIFIIYLAKSIKTENYDTCINQGGNIDYNGDSIYCEIGGQIYFRSNNPSL